jgi:hypothetical protein
MIAASSGAARVAPFFDFFNDLVDKCLKIIR